MTEPSLSESMLPPRPRRRPFKRLLELFSSIWLGVTLLSLLFIYSSIGSAGLPIGRGMTRWPFITNPDAWVSVREVFELSEFQWFHWWPFDLLIALICINLVVATLRRIPFNIINLGVWMIHTGIITLALGSVWYFSTKVEGDAPLARRRIVAQIPGYDPISLTAAPGNTAIIGQGDQQYTLRVQDIDPNWELLSGDDAGTHAYKVSVLIQSPTESFIRVLLAGYPQYTEDLVRSEDPNQPFMRAKKAPGLDGAAIVDDILALDLTYDVQDHFYLMGSAALYLREVEARRDVAHNHAPNAQHCLTCGMVIDEGERSPWIQRPINTKRDSLTGLVQRVAAAFAPGIDASPAPLPRFNDYIASYDSVWMSPAMSGESDNAPPRLDPLHVEVPPARADDPLPRTTFLISEYLPYTTLETRRIPGGERLNPAITLDVRNTRGQSDRIEMLALDAQRRFGGRGQIEFVWAESDEDVALYERAFVPTLVISIVDEGVSFTQPIVIPADDETEPTFIPIENTDYAYRVLAAQDALNVSGQTLAVAIVEIRRGEKQWTRWVFDDPSHNRDLTGEESDAAMAAHSANRLLDRAIRMIYIPARLRIVAGPDENDLRLMNPHTASGMEVMPLGVGETVELPGGISMRTASYAARSRTESRPVLIPKSQRRRDIGMEASMLKLTIPPPENSPGSTGGTASSLWLPFHIYPFANRRDVLTRFPYNPSIVHLPNGKHVELMLSRERRPLPSPVALEDFEWQTEIGGYAGNTQSIRNWTSIVRFRENDAWNDPIAVSVNDPRENHGYWFFQSQWDPPSEQTGSSGLNYTVLGVGNRQGVHVQLLGCCIAVLGMIFAFYIKPAIKRRRQQAVYAEVASRTPGHRGNGLAPRAAASLDVVGSGMEKQG